MSFFNSSNFGKIDLRSSPSLKPNTIKKDNAGGSDLEQTLGNPLLANFKSNSGKENVLTSFNLMPILCTASNKENAVLEFSQEKTLTDKLETQKLRQV